VAFQICPSKLPELQISVAKARIYFVSDLKFSGVHKIGLGGKDEQY
jgi:hypothetical protein